MSGRAKKRIGDVCQVFDGPHATPPKSDEGPIYLGITSLLPDGGIDYEGSKRIAWDDYPKWTKRVTPQKDDVVFSYEATLGQYAIIPDGFVGCLGRRMAVMRPDQEQIDPRFLLYYMRSAQWQSVIACNTVTGATVNRIPIATFPSFPIEVPSLPEQQRIASVLAAYDKLIENNHKQIALLEEAAQRLYKEWFCDLRFPGYESTPIHDGLPEGWRRSMLGEICQLMKEASKDSDRSSSTPYIGLEHMPRKSICLSVYGDVTSVSGNKLRFKSGDILFGKIRPYFHKVGFAQCDGVASTDTIILRAHESCFSLLLECMASDDFVAYATKTSKTGTKMPRADWDAMKRYPMLVPPSELLAAFDGFVSKICNEIVVLSKQSTAAREARDRLLPRLMSGEIQV